MPNGLIESLPLTYPPASRNNILLPLTRNVCMSCLFACLTLANIASVEAQAKAEDAFPTSAEFAKLDEVIESFRERLNASGATLCVSEQGKIVHSRAFGFSDQKRKVPTKPEALFRIASVSKPITAAVVRELIDEGKLQSNERVVDRLNIKASRDHEFDERYGEITISHLLDHRGGWDRSETFDPVFRSRQVAEELRLRGPVQIPHLIQYMARRPLQFDPGSKSAYSNFGYMLLGELIEDATGQSYIKAVRSIVGEKIGSKEFYLSRTAERAKFEGEVEYPVNAHRFQIELVGGAGALVTSAPTLCQFMEHYWLNGKPRTRRENVHWVFFGSLPGTSSMARQHISGINVAVLLNNRRDRDFNEDNNWLKDSVDEVIDEILKERHRQAILDRKNKQP